MSLEATVQENTAVMRELIAALTRGVPVAASTVADVVGKIAEKDPEVKKSETKISGDAKTASSQPGVTQPSADPKVGAQGTETKKAEALTYDQVKAKLLTLSKEKGREPTVALLQRHGVVKGPDLKPEQYAQFITDVDAILAGTYNPEEAELA